LQCWEEKKITNGPESFLKAIILFSDSKNTEISEKGCPVIDVCPLATINSEPGLIRKKKT
jgi:hypothetical protein